MIRRPSMKEKELRRMFANEPMKLELALLELESLTDYELQMRSVDIRKKYKAITDYDAEIQYLKVNLDHRRIPTEKEYKQLMLDIHLKYGKITDRDHGHASIELIEDERVREVAVLNHLLKFKDITQDEYDKEISTINGEPWFKFVAVLEEDDIRMNVMYNELFLKKCKEDGHPGENEDEIIEYFIKDFGRKLHADDSEVPEELVHMEDPMGINKTVEP